MEIKFYAKANKKHIEYIEGAIREMAKAGLLDKWELTIRNEEPPKVRS